MSKFLTPPVWYDKNGNLNEMLTGNAASSGDIAIGSGSTANGGGIAIGGRASGGGIAIGGSASGGINTSSIVIGHNANANAGDSIIIGNSSSSSYMSSGTIIIGNNVNLGTSNMPNMIQLGDDDNSKYTLQVGNGRMSLSIGSTAESNWVSATSDGISQGLYLVRYGAGPYINTVYLMAPISVTNSSVDGTSTYDWYFPFNISPSILTIDGGRAVVANSYYLKVDKNSSASNLQITPGYYDTSNTFVNMSDGSSVMLFKIL